MQHWPQVARRAIVDAFWSEVAFGMEKPARRIAGFGLVRSDAGRPFFALFYVFILIGWFPQLQVAYSYAQRGVTFGLALGVIGLVAGYAWASGRIADVLLAAGSGALGTAAAVVLGAALTAELASVRDFYASTLDPAALRSALWGEFMWAIVGSWLGVLAGGLAATVLAGPVRLALDIRGAALALISVPLVAAAIALVAASVDLVVAAVASAGVAPSSAAPVGAGPMRIGVLLICSLAALSAAFGCRASGDGPLVRFGGGRLLVALALVAVPFAVAAVYRSFVLNPF